ncbi:MAG: cell division protein FtsZ [Bacteroidetes bacterium]|nr:cell division protein FtsZ [Bacteroidota bacterium]
MLEDLIDFSLPVNDNAIITVVGLGGGGNNAVNRMFEQGIQDVDFLVANTDAQALLLSNVPLKVRIGETLTEGRGAGNRPDIGEQAAIENIEDVMENMSDNTKMVFLVAGMGGGTGTGATPVIPKACREMGLLTVAVVTLPFRFEGPLRMKQAVQGIDRLKDTVDALLIIHNEKLREIFGNLTLSNAFGNADNVLMLAVKGIAEIITVHGYINVDFADVLSVMSGGGIAFMGSAEATGHDRARNVIDDTINSPLLNNNDIIGARKVLLNIAYGLEEITVDEIGTITDKIIDKVGGSVNTIWGTCYDETLGDRIRITLVATGFSTENIEEIITRNPPEKKTVTLSEKNDVIPLDEIMPVRQNENIPNDDDAVKDESGSIEKMTTKVSGESPNLKEPEESPELMKFIIEDRAEDKVEGKVEDREEKSIDEEVDGKPDDQKYESGPVFELEAESEADKYVEREKAANKEPEFDPYSEEKERLRIKAERLKALNYNNITDPQKVDELEREPAYKRKPIPIQTEIFPDEHEKSRYSVGGKDSKLRTKNDYLHDVVD